LTLPSLNAHLFADNGVTKLMVKNGANPSTCRRLKEFSGDHDLSLSDVARSKDTLLSAGAPRNDIRIELRPIGEVLDSKIGPYPEKKFVALGWCSRRSGARAGASVAGYACCGSSKKELDLPK
jgi:hypothetical protein